MAKTAGSHKVAEPVQGANSLWPDTLSEPCSRRFLSCDCLGRFSA